MQLSCRYGSQHFLGIMKRSQFLPEDLKVVIDAVLQRNGYFGHFVHILLAI
ncbi:hypothetical protein ILUMI_14546, partial [Ignelater luminosus]